MLLDIQPRLMVADDLWVYVEIGGRRMPLCRTALPTVMELRSWDEFEKRRLAEAQTGPEPGPGGLYPEGSQE